MKEEHECKYCIHRDKDFFTEEPCKSCTDPDDSKRVCGYEVDVQKIKELLD